MKAQAIRAQNPQIWDKINKVFSEVKDLMDNSVWAQIGYLNIHRYGIDIETRTYIDKEPVLIRMEYVAANDEFKLNKVSISMIRPLDKEIREAFKEIAKINGYETIELDSYIIALKELH